jgi:hypothetical protein
VNNHCIYAFVAWLTSTLSKCIVVNVMCGNHPFDHTLYILTTSTSINAQACWYDWRVLHMLVLIGQIIYHKHIKHHATDHAGCCLDSSFTEVDNVSKKWIMGGVVYWKADGGLYSSACDPRNIYVCIMGCRRWFNKWYCHTISGCQIFNIKSSCSIPSRRVTSNHFWWRSRAAGYK